MSQITNQEWYRLLALKLVEHHKRHCDGETCHISLGSIREMAEAAGAQFTEADYREFM